MNSIILCKGSSDFVLLQYYMRTVYGWTDERTQNIRLDSIKRSRTLKKDENLLTIGGCGGCSKIIPEFEKILQRNSISAVGEAFDKVVIITDRDEVGTEEEFIEKINTSVQKYQLMMKDDIKNNTWLSCEYQNGHGKKQIMELLLLVIPFEDTVSGSAEGSYVISFCTSGDSLLMWSEYSDFMGYCMEFEYGKLKETFQEHCGNDSTLFDGKVIYDHDEQIELLEDTIERLLLSDGEDYKTIYGWDDLDSAEEEDVKLFVDHISVICLLYNMFFKKECFAQEQEYRMVFLCVHKREHQVPENSIPVEYRIKDEVFIPFIRMKLGDISCLKSVCVGTKNTSDLAVKGLRHYFGSRNLEVHVRKSEIPLRY